MSTLYDSVDKTIRCKDVTYKHCSGGETSDEFAHTLARFGAGEITFQKAWLILKYVHYHCQDDGYTDKTDVVFKDEFNKYKEELDEIKDNLEEK